MLARRWETWFDGAHIVLGCAEEAHEVGVGDELGTKGKGLSSWFWAIQQAVTGLTCDRLRHLMVVVQIGNCDAGVAAARCCDCLDAIPQFSSLRGDQ